ncbi:Short-chain dehydrogenase/reductase eupG [Pseudocercospora fuligena]|uniref:Short-chain dehydrogenase/reductase eupG n=1 Tax=Pseudocercospora fuligena TaxID=685502 RepID=A0A8H6VD30_9PEZI|nr:Short-chain dehydrogenase/reductase eupG [Pseudocercospora fuligena]
MAQRCTGTKMTKTIVLITGANSGLGYALTAALLADAGKHVLMGCRSIQKGRKAMDELSNLNLPGSMELLEIDVSNDSSISKAAEIVTEKHGRLDVLVNNAAVGWQTGTLSKQMAAAYQTNTIGVFLTTEAFTPLLKKASSTPRVINISSGAGSISRTLDLGTNVPYNTLGPRAVAYCGSKAAMNLITATHARVLEPEAFRVFAYSPGFIVSNLGPHNDAEHGARPAEEAAVPLVGLINGDRDDEHGCFLRATGQQTW